MYFIVVTGIDNESHCNRTLHCHSIYYKILTGLAIGGIGCILKIARIRVHGTGPDRINSYSIFVPTVHMRLLPGFGYVLLAKRRGVM